MVDKEIGPTLGSRPAVLYGRKQDALLPSGCNFSAR